MNFSNFFNELKRRNVIRVATAYAIAGWLIIQVVTAINDPLGLPDWFDTAIIILVLIGLPFALIFAWAFELTPDGLKKSREVDITESVTKATGKKLNGLIIGVLSIALIFVLIERVFFAKAAILENEVAQVQSASIAVLPFVNMSGDEENEYFSDGLSEELLNVLAKVEDLKVAGRTSSFKFKGQNENLTEIGQELNVDHILEGSVRKSGNRIRITAQLIKVDDGYHIWSDAFDRELTINNIFEIQEEISKTVMEVLKVKLLPEEELVLSSRPTVDIEAYNAFLEGTQLSISNQPDDLLKAIEKFQQAIRFDQSFAEAYARLAIAYERLNAFGNFPLEEAKLRMRENIDRALLLDGNLGRAYEALGYYNLMTFEAEGALVAFERAVELMPNDPEVYDGLHLALEHNERYPEANEALKQAYLKDPLNPSYASSYANHRVNSDGEFEESLAIFDKMIETYPDYTLTYRYKAGMISETPFGQIDEAFKVLYEAYSRKPEDIVLIRALASYSLSLDFMPLAYHLEDKIAELYPDNEGYYWIRLSNRSQDQRYDETQTLLLEALSSFGEQSLDEISQFQASVFFAQGRFEQGIEIMESTYPELLEQPVNIDETNNGKVALYSNLLEQTGNTERAAELRATFCAFNEKQIDESTNDREKTWQRWDRVSCMIYEDDFSGAISLMEELFFEKNSKSNIPNYIHSASDLLPLREMPEFQDLKQRMMNEIHIQRANVIRYLKEQGDWRDEWDIEN